MTPLSTMPAGRLHGRDAELGVIRDEFGHLAEGTGAVVVVEGAAGMGKSRLLAEASSIARELGIRVGIAAADPGESVVELSALLSALSDGVEPLLDRRELTSLRAEPEQRFWVLRDLQALLERSALDSPLLIGIDDAHWADAGTAAALRTLPVLLSGLPIAWLIAVRPSHESAPLATALVQLERSGARRVVLDPLDSEAVRHLTAELLGAEPTSPATAMKRSRSQTRCCGRRCQPSRRPRSA